MRFNGSVSGGVSGMMEILGEGDTINITPALTSGVEVATFKINEGTTEEETIKLYAPNTITWDNVTNKPNLFSGSYPDLSSKPTLNGETINGNMFTHNYSLNEQRVGTWIDGKPLYQKTFTKLLTNVNDYIDLISIDDIDIFMGVVQGVTRYSETSFNQDITIPYYSNPNYYMRIYYISNGLSDLGTGYPDNQILFLESSNEGLRYYKNVTFTIQYTKSTDNIA